ncbi:MAG TPA: DUF192 domain-containing protein [Gaiellaceae bacterium]|nr:DUF192 domain-containing protein [Gaiellaceae bacterium]
MRVAAVLASLLLLAACGGDGDERADGTSTTAAGDPPAAASGEERGPRVVIETDGGEVEVAVEVADDPDERQVGLMHRESLPAESGMIFLFERDSSGGFWMKNTLVPLSIAFADGSGEILRILDMEPCETDPCEIYDPGVFYRSALEVNQGAFARWGVEEGDRLRLERR